MLGKQWLNRYESTDMRGTPIERSQNRQRKLDGIHKWYFETVMESMPVMLQAALLLLGCALSLYLWGIDTVIASVVLSITSFGALFYISITIAAVATKNCPYQTPVSRLLCYLGQNIKDALAVVASTLRTSARHLSTVHTRSHTPPPTPEPPLTGQTPALDPAPDLRCVSWTLQTSLAGGDHRSALEYLMSMQEHAGFERTLVVNCLNIFIGGIRGSHGKVIIRQGLEQLATASAECIYRTFYRLTVIDSTSGDLRDIRQLYREALPDRTKFRRFPFRYTMFMIDTLIEGIWDPHGVWHGDDRPSEEEHIQFAQDIAELTQAECSRGGTVPEWTRNFAFNSLFLEPMPPAPVVGSCFEIIATDLGYDFSKATTSHKGYIHFSPICIHLLTKS